MTDGDFVGIRVWFFPNCEVGMIGLFGIRGRGEREGRLWVFRMVSSFLGAVLLGTLDYIWESGGGGWCLYEVVMMGFLGVLLL